MAFSAVGLKTQIWNNNIKAFLFLLFYPIIITSAYAAIMGIVFFYVAMDPHTHVPSEELLQLFHTLALDYWYVPYALTLVFLVGMFWYDRNRLDIDRGMHIVTREKRPELYGFLENLCISRGLPTPYFFVQQHPACNAYTTGLTPSSYRIVITSGLVEKLSNDEVECVLAHELTHLLNGDTRLLFLTGTVTNMFQTLADIVWPQSYYTNEIPINRSIEDPSPKQDGYLLRLCIGAVLKLANLGALFTQLLISRKREYIADAGAVELTKNPRALISALKKVGADSAGFKDAAIKPTLFNYSDDGWFATHPSIEDRIAAIAYYNRIEPEKRPPWKGKVIRQAIAEKDVVW